MSSLQFEEGRDGFGDNMTVWKNPSNWSLLTAREQTKEGEQAIQHLKQGFRHVGKVSYALPEHRRPKMKTQVSSHSGVLCARLGSLESGVWRY